MATQNRVFVSPGVFTLERDLTFVVRQVGVTTLGIAGETPKGPAFEPIGIDNYTDYKAIFGGLDPCKYPSSGYPKYEANYIAKSYLRESNQLFVTRILGLSGYRAGDAWNMVLLGGPDDGERLAESIDISFSATCVTSGTSIVCTFDDGILQALFDDGKLDGILTGVGGSAAGTSIPNQDITYTRNGGLSVGEFSGATISGASITVSGATSTDFTGMTTTYTTIPYEDVEGVAIMTLRSTADIDAEEIITFSVDGATGLTLNVGAAATNPLGAFSLTGTTTDGDGIDLGASLDRTKKNYIVRVLGERCSTCNLGAGPLYIEELYTELFDKFVIQDKVWGIDGDLCHIPVTAVGSGFDNYLTTYRPAETPYVVSELRGNKLFRLFKFWTISDGDAANTDVKISIANIDPDNRTFDILVRAWGDTDANPRVLERFSRVTMDSKENNYVARSVGTLDGEFDRNSKYILIEMADGCLDDAFPAGFEGYPVRDFDSFCTGVQAPGVCYKTNYEIGERKRRIFLGISDTIGFDSDLFRFKGLPPTPGMLMWTGTTNGFHLDIDATGATIDGIFTVINTSGDTFEPTFFFETGCCEFRNGNDLDGTDYEKLNSRKFTLVPYGGFDGWDIFRDERTNRDKYRAGTNDKANPSTSGDKGLTSGLFDLFANDEGDTVNSSDYYAYLLGIRKFANPEATNINILTTPGVNAFDHSNIIEDTIDMVETERCDSLYIMTTPDANVDGEAFTADNVSSDLDGLYDSNYTATYWPWVQFNDTENNVFVWLPPTYDVVRNMALTDNVSFPWFATAGVNRGVVDANKARKKLSQDERDTLYENRINPIASFNDVGVVIWGNKTLQERETALNRINVRRLLLRARKLISAVSVRLLFEQNDDIVRNQFLGLVNPILENIRRERGLTDFRVVLDNSPESIDRNELCGQVFIKPTRALEFICVEFTITNTGASFDDL